MRSLFRWIVAGAGLEVGRTLARAGIDELQRQKREARRARQRRLLVLSALALCAAGLIVGLGIAFDAEGWALAALCGLGLGVGAGAALKPRVSAKLATVRVHREERERVRRSQALLRELGD